MAVAEVKLDERLNLIMLMFRAQRAIFLMMMTLLLYVFPDQRITNQVQDSITSKFGKPEQVFLQNAMGM